MSTAHWDRVRELFEQVADLPEGQRRGHLENMCPGDSALQAEVLSLLEHDQRAAPEFLAPPNLFPMEGGIEGAAVGEGDRLVGTRLGRYQIKRLIASGGMGTVYEAEQDHPHRTVAIKVMHAWAHSKSIRRRFEFEIETLARLTHPNIARIYDAGVLSEAGVVSEPQQHGAADPSRGREPADIPGIERKRHDSPGLPYFVMEYVPDAQTIIAFAEQRHLHTSARLELFIQACDAVQHGHQRGIIHRDLKPANILVSVEGTGGTAETPKYRNAENVEGHSGESLPSIDNRHSAIDNPLVKVIDFGIARTTDADQAATQVTQTGQLLGTIQYMSPEQCEGDPRELDVRTDVYSLGVVLYQLLCGQMPYGEGSKAARQRGTKVNPSRGHKPTDGERKDPLCDISQMGKENLCPPLVTGLAPGARITAPTPSAYQMFKSICESPPVRPRTIDRSLPRNIEFVLLKCLEKDPDRRYQSVADLARDLRHILAREPIDARPPNIATSFTRWVARHPIASTALAAATVGTAVLVGFFAAIQWVQFRPHRLERIDNNRDAVLFSFNGNELHHWATPTREGISPAELIQTDVPSLPTIALVGYPACKQGYRCGQLCAFDIDRGEFKRPAWCTQVAPGDVPTDGAERGFEARDFGPYAFLGAFDIFPNVAGKELVVNFTHSYSRRAVRIIGSEDGAVLYQVWHDGNVTSAAWLNNAGTLVFAGTNDEVEWEYRGVPATVGRFYPWVVWGIRPEIGTRSNKYICTGRTGSCVDPAWYKCIWPGDSTSVFARLTVGNSPQSRYDDGKHFLIRLTYDSIYATSTPEEPGTGGWLADEHGDRVDDSWFRNNNCTQLRTSAPQIEGFRLAKLPAIRAQKPGSTE